MTDEYNAYREKLKARQQQEYADRGKTGLGKKSVLDLNRTGVRQVNFFQPKYIPDVNFLDIIPFIITQDWYQKLRAISGRANGLEVGYWDYKLQVPVHKGVGNNNDVVLCLREAFGGLCVRCDEMFEAHRSGDKDKAKELRCGWRCFYNIYDYDNPDPGIQLMELPYYSFEATSTLNPQRANLFDAMMLDPGGPKLFYDLETGSTLALKFMKKVLGKSEFPEIFEIAFETRDPYSEDILRQVYPLDSMLIIPTPDEVRILHYAITEEGEEGAIPEDQKTAAEETDTATSSEKAPDRSSRGRTTMGKQTTPVSSSPEKESEQTASEKESEQTALEKKPERSAPTREPISSTKCPAGNVFGKDCNSGPECQGKTDAGCDDTIFSECSTEYMRLGQEASTGSEKEKATAPAVDASPPASETPPATPPSSTGGRATGRSRRNK